MNENRFFRLVGFAGRVHQGDIFLISGRRRDESFLECLPVVTSWTKLTMSRETQKTDPADCCPIVPEDGPASG
jgi:hypothetical protein